MRLWDGWFRWISTIASRYCALIVGLFTLACGSGRSKDSKQTEGPVDSSGGSYVDVVPTDDEDGGTDGVADDTVDAVMSNSDAVTSETTIVTGTVVDINTQRPLMGRLVFIGTQSATTDAGGAFKLESRGSTYDVAIMDPDKSTITVYQGLKRTDPILGHRPSPRTASHQNTGGIDGNFSGGSWPLAPNDFASVYVFSIGAVGHLSLGGSQPPFGPAYGPLYLSWDGPVSVPAQLVGLATMVDPAGDGGLSAWFFQQDIGLSARSTVSTTIPIAPVPWGHLTGDVEVPAGSALTQLAQYYRLSLPNAIVEVGNEDRGNTSDTSFDYLLADIDGGGRSLCGLAVSRSSGNLSTERCGLALGGAPVTLTLQSAPALQMPADGSQVDQNTTFVWTPFDHGIHILALEVPLPAPDEPSIYLVTDATNARLPDLTSWGVSLPHGMAYTATVGGLGPFATLDDAVGPRGLGAYVAVESRRSYSAPISLSTN